MSIEDKPHLTLAGIYSALAYYYANKESLDVEFAAYDRECDRLETEYQGTEFDTLERYCKKGVNRQQQSLYSWLVQ
ncbi:MAG: hypothetical protein QNJ47_08915 [Nostocaceae cyanobacterium]|nr:hypothetical protein [Nostocaceae cyanobacterium]